MVARRICNNAFSELSTNCFTFRELGAEDEPADESGLSLSLWRLEVLCAYADPNYGSLWFWCRESSLSTPREVLLQMREEVSRNLLTGGLLWVYTWAVACSVFGIESGTGTADISLERTNTPPAQP